MAWLDDAIIIVRNLINDTQSPQTYDDNRLQELIMTSAFLVVTDITSLETSYTVNMSNLSVSPDPSNDSFFMSFVCLKSACLVDQSNLRTKALVAGIVAKCGPAVLDTMKHMDGFKELITIGPCATYQSMKYDYMFGGGRICEGILSPFISNKFNPENLGLKFSDARNSYFM
jgi:hypothetical protein